MLNIFLSVDLSLSIILYVSICNCNFRNQILPGLLDPCRSPREAFVPFEQVVFGGRLASVTKMFIVFQKLY